MRIRSGRTRSLIGGIAALLVMMSRPRCGQPVGSGDAFCRHCGADMQED